MLKPIHAGLVYFLIVMGTGFLLGVIRVSFVVPFIGERWAELAEMPLMALVIYLSAGFVLRRFPEVAFPASALAAGFLALALSVVVELSLAILLQERTLAEFIANRDKVSGSVYISLLMVFAVMPRIRLINQAHN